MKITKHGIAESDQLEVWKDVGEFTGLYLVSNSGRVKSLTKGIIMSEQVTKKGYVFISLRVNGKTFNRFLHRLVAIAFIPNESNKPQVNHKDLNKKNNLLSNLEWVDQSENQLHSYANSDRVSGMKNKSGKLHARSKPVLMISLDGKTITEFESQRQAEKLTGISSGHINSVLKGKRNKAGNHYWKNK